MDVWSEVNGLLKEIDKSVPEMDIKIINPELFIKRIKRLITIIKIDGDFTGKREAYSILDHISDEKIVYLLIDNVNYFRTLTLTRYEKCRWCLKAAMTGSVAIAEFLFDDKDINPKTNERILSYVLCSGNIAWFKELIQKWNVDITKKEYCIPYYMNILKSTL